MRCEKAGVLAGRYACEVLDAWQYPQCADPAAPAMSVVDVESVDEAHSLTSIRDHDPVAEGLIHVLVARVAGFREMKDDPKLRQSVVEEYNKLRSWPIWNEEAVV